jgi:hypothetical protein
MAASRRLETSPPRKERSFPTRGAANWSTRLFAFVRVRRNGLARQCRGHASSLCFFASEKRARDRNSKRAVIRRRVGNGSNRLNSPFGDWFVLRHSAGLLPIISRAVPDDSCAMVEGARGRSMDRKLAAILVADVGYGRLAGGDEE